MRNRFPGQAVTNGTSPASYLLPLAALEIYLRAKDGGSAGVRLTTTVGLFALTAVIGLAWVPGYGLALLAAAILTIFQWFAVPFALRRRPSCGAATA